MNWLLIIILIFAILTAVYQMSKLYTRAMMPYKMKHGGGRDKLMAHKRNIPAREYSLRDSIALIDNEHIDNAVRQCATCVTYDDIPTGMPYKRTTHTLKTNLHIGQLKLFLTELEFLTYCLPAYDTPAIVIYAGSSPSNKISHLADMFPATKFVLIDPNEHYVMYPDGDQYEEQHIEEFLYFVAAEGDRYGLGRRKINYYSPSGPLVLHRGEKMGKYPADLADVIADNDTARYFVIEDYMDNELAKTLAPLTARGPVYFISDIRTLNEEEGNPSDLHILWNSAMMYNWLRLLRPTRYMLKFHTPYLNMSDIEQRYAQAEYMHADFAAAKPDIDFLGDYLAGEYRFLAADQIWLQAFAGPTSSETRHVGTSLDVVRFDCRAFEDKLFFYNRIIRPYGWHTEHEQYLDSGIGIDRCGDCALMCRIFADYSRKYGFSVEPGKIIGGITHLLRTIKRQLTAADSVHGLYYFQYPNRRALMTAQESLIALQIVKQHFKQSHASVHRATIADVYNKLRVYEYLDDELKGVKTENKSGAALMYATLKVGDIFGYKSNEFRIACEFKLDQFVLPDKIKTLTNKIINIMSDDKHSINIKPINDKLQIGKYEVVNRTLNAQPLQSAAASVFDIGISLTKIDSNEWLDFIRDICIEYNIKEITTITTTIIHSINTPQNIDTQNLTLYDCPVNWLEKKNITGELIVVRLSKISDFLRAFIYDTLSKWELRSVILNTSIDDTSKNVFSSDVYYVKGISDIDMSVQLINIDQKIIDQSKMNIIKRIARTRRCIL